MGNTLAQWQDTGSIDRIFLSRLASERMDSAGMRVEYLETFLDLVQTRNFQRTAERLNITQSTVSARIRSLGGGDRREPLHPRPIGRGTHPEGRKFENYAINIRLCWNLA